ncbi:MAG: hypothetical protein JXA97_06160 [Anaerolineales bacterium]|nr:hypothetical protein [Anaerolineales bacterium]
MMGNFITGDRIQAEFRKAKLEEAERQRLLCSLVEHSPTIGQKIAGGVGKYLVHLGDTLLDLSNSTPPTLHYS